MTTRVQGTGTYTPTRHSGSGTFTSTTAAEYTAALANMQSDPNYVITSAKSNTRTIQFTFDIALPPPPDILAEYQRALAKLQSILVASAYLLTSTTLATRTIVYSFDTNRGPL